jgi:dTDP-4-dehydrorhamnose reductase
MKAVLVTGSEGQLGQSLQKIAYKYPDLKFYFYAYSDLDITNREAVENVFNNIKFGFCINCAAYTQVDKAEKESELAFAVNAEGAKNIAEACAKHKVILIQISTDYVFNGEKESGYTITDKPNPINEYGKSKLKGEEYVQKTLESHIIIRTSWLYSEFGNNFYKTILSKAQEQEVLKVVDNERGCPTNANNLANYILHGISNENMQFGIIHFTDGEVMSWYEFARKILIENKLDGSVRLEKAENYRTFARRPKNSILISHTSKK